MGSSGGGEDARRSGNPATIARELAGDALERVPGLDPPRWRFTAWPPPAAVAELRARAERAE